MALRDHEPIVLEDFGGLWARGDAESCPSDHFIVADNIQYLHSGLETRDALDKWQTVAVPLTRVKRIYNYVMQTGQSLLVLVDNGRLWHCIGPDVQHLILVIPDMDDFGFVAINGRAYITPFTSYYDTHGFKYQLGIKDEYVYVYKGDGVTARKAAGFPPTGTPLVAELSSEDGKTDTGMHVLAVVYETDTGFLTGLGPEAFAELEFDGVHKIHVSNVTIPDAEHALYAKKRHIVSTKWIPEYNGDQKGYQFFFVPNATLDNITDTEITFEFFDADLLSDASHLLDNMSEIPSGVNLNTYHSRMVVVGEFGITETLEGLPPGILDNRSIARVSAAGEPEAFSKVDGILITPLDGNPLTNVQEFRDVLYLFKRTRTYAYSDNNDEPVTWQEEVVDQGVGAPVHGIGTVLDSGGVNVDFLLIADWSGLMLFNGTYARPELSWKIEDFWLSLDRFEFQRIQLVNDSISKKIWMTLPIPFQPVVLHADYGDGLDAKNIHWSKWIFDVDITSACLIESKKLILGAFDPPTVTPLIVSPPVSDVGGIYYINPLKAILTGGSRHDSYYDRGPLEIPPQPPSSTGSIERKIPDPTIKTGLFGE